MEWGPGELQVRYGTLPVLLQRTRLRWKDLTGMCRVLWANSNESPKRAVSRCKESWFGHQIKPEATHQIIRMK